MTEIVVERGTKDQRVFQPFARLIVAGFHLDLTPTGLHAAPGVGEGDCERHFQWHESRFSRVPRLPFGQANRAASCRRTLAHFQPTCSLSTPRRASLSDFNRLTSWINRVVTLAF
jgi:hypothetical protein